MMDIFDQGVKVLQDVPQLEPILLKNLFRTHGKKTLKAPQRPITQPKPPDPNNKSILPEENTWLWDSYMKVKDNMEECIKPL